MFNIDFCYFFCYYSFALFCGNSSVDRASRCQREGRGFEPRFPLHFIIWRYSQVVRHESANVLSIAFKVLILKGYKNSGGIRVGKRTKESIIK